MTESDAPSGKPQSYTRKTLGDSDDKPKAPEIYKCCSNPQITYLAPVNINIDERTIGSVDVWRCASCCLLYTSPSPRDGLLSRMPSSA